MSSENDTPTAPVERLVMPFFEEVAERFCGHVSASRVREATDEEIAKAERLHLAGQCPHNIVTDEKGWLYDCRVCFTCGKGLGSV